MEEKTVGVFAIILGLGLLAAGVGMTVMAEALYGAAVGEVKITDAPGRVAPGETFAVDFVAKVYDSSYEGTYHIKAYPRGSPKEEFWQGEKDKYLMAQLLTGTMDVTAPSEGLWADYEDLGLRLAGNDGNGYYYLEGVNKVYIDVKPEKITHTLSISVDGQGSTSPSEGSHTYDDGSEVSVSASPAPGWDFDRWSGDASGTSPSVTVTMTSDKSVTAHFVESVAEYRLTTSVQPSGSGYVTPSSGTYSDGEEVTLEATAYSGYEFDHWSGDASGTANPTTVVMDSNRHIYANFVEVAPPKYALTAEVAQGQGTATPSSGVYEEGTSVEITADPAEGYAFERWGGDASGSENPKTITMNSDKDILVYFKEEAPEEVTLTLRSNPPGGGSITMLQSRQVSVEKGTVVSLQPFPNSSFEFSHWSGDVSGTDKLLRFVANEDSAIIANFKEIKTPWDILVDNLNLVMIILGTTIAVGGLVIVRSG